MNTFLNLPVTTVVIKKRVRSSSDMSSITAAPFCLHIYYHPVPPSILISVMKELRKSSVMAFIPERLPSCNIIVYELSVLSFSINIIITDYVMALSASSASGRKNIIMSQTITNGPGPPSVLRTGRRTTDRCLPLNSSPRWARSHWAHARVPSSSPLLSGNGFHLISISFWWV